ncbi:hypothetical protein H0H87_002237 [Tephrocybe sp. NHM501043]|nr:hypothetical protein H0H87_002237 [Tephrocybe sp. NHM501043]
MATSTKAVQTFGKKKASVAHAKEGRGLIRINGSPINLVQPEILRLKVYEPILVAGEESFGPLDIRVRVKGGGHTSQVYAIRQAIAKALVAYYAKYIDAYSALELKKKLVAYDRTLLIADPRRMEPKKFGGAGARARRQKSSDLMDHHLTLQAPEIPLIFQDGASQWRVFVSASGINGRPKLVRTLKKAGAFICSDPKQSNVILVDATSESGKAFIREWGNDTDKVVLKHSWANACISSSKALGKDDDWGGFLAIDDGLPLTKNGSEITEDLPVCSLPTPRITPAEAPSPASTQQARIPAPAPPHVAAMLPHNTISNTPPNTFDGSYMALYMQQMLQQQQQAFLHMQMQMQQQQPTFTGTNSMPSFVYPPDPNNPLSSFPLSMPQLSQSMNSYNPNPFFTSPNQNTPFPPETSSSAEPPDFQTRAHAVPPSLRRKSPILPRSTPSSHTSDAQMRSISPTSMHIPSASSYQHPSQPASLLSTLFKTEDGEQITFFVQIGLYKRSDTVNAIKKHGGKIVTNHCNADFAVFYTREKPNDQLYEAAVAAGRPTVIPAFVHDCITQNKILDTSPYNFPTSHDRTPTRGGKRKRVKSEDEGDIPLAEKAQTKRLERNRRERERKEQVVKAAEQQSPPQRSNHSGRRSPSPPPEHTREKRRGSGNYSYSEREREYATEYLKYLLEDDHLISGFAIAKALHRKASLLMDHHSLGSWRTFLTQEPFKTTLESSRKTAGIAFRKRKALEELSAKKSELLEKEIGIIAHFFATGGGKQSTDEDEDENDAVIWERLTQQHQQSQTFPSWSDLYNEHHQEVTKRYEELVQGLTTSEST